MSSRSTAAAAAGCRPAPPSRVAICPGLKQLVSLKTVVQGRKQAGALVVRADSEEENGQPMIREWPYPAFVAEVIAAFPDKAIATVEEARVSAARHDQLLVCQLSTKSRCRKCPVTMLLTTTACRSQICIPQAQSPRVLNLALCTLGRMHSLHNPIMLKVSIFYHQNCNLHAIVDPPGTVSLCFSLHFPRFLGLEDILLWAL
jgi:hypothetical protein